MDSVAEFKSLNSLKNTSCYKVGEMGYKTINLQTQVLKGSVKPSKVVEKHQNKTQNDPANRLGIGGADEGGGGNGGWCCERLNKNIHRWLETKFGMFPVSCFPFKLGHSATSDPHPKSNRQQSTHKVHSEKTIYVDCSDKWEYEVISWNKPQSAVIDRDVNNSFKVVAVSTPPTVSKIVDIEFDHFDDIENHRRRSSSRNRDRSNSSASIKSRFEKRLNRIKKMGNENKIAESIEMEEKSEDQEMRSLSSLSKDRITFSSIFGDASLFESELEESRVEDDPSTQDLRSDSDLDDDYQESEYVDEETNPESELAIEVQEGYISLSDEDTFDFSDESDFNNSSSSKSVYF